MFQHDFFSEVQSGNDGKNETENKAITQNAKIIDLTQNDHIMDIPPVSETARSGHNDVCENQVNSRSGPSVVLTRIGLLFVIITIKFALTNFFYLFRIFTAQKRRNYSIGFEK